MGRYVSIKSRKIAIEPTLIADSRWKQLKGPIKGFLNNVRAGEDLAPYLSIQPNLKGYSPEASKTGTDINRWTDKGGYGM